MNGDHRSPGFYHGSELPRLLVLAGIMVAGWAGLWLWAGSSQPEPPPRPVADAPPLPPPDDSPPFQGLIDRTGMTARDNAAYAALLGRVRSTPFVELNQQARRDVLFSQLIEDPERYRGLPVHVEGTALRVIRQNVQDSRIYPDGVYYEAYAISPDSQNNPWVLAFEQAPAGLEGGDNLRQRITFDGYFLKLWAYEAGDKFRVAPLLVGRFPPVSETVAKGARGFRFDDRLWPILLLVLLTLYFGVRLVLQLRRSASRASQRLAHHPPVSDQIDPDRLNAWVEGQAQPDENQDWDERV